MAGAVLVILKGIEALFKPLETWVRQDKTMTRLRGEQLLFRTQAPPYTSSGRDDIGLYAQNVQTILQNENALWGETFRTSPESAKGDQDKK